MNRWLQGRFSGNCQIHIGEAPYYQHSQAHVFAYYFQLSLCESNVAHTLESSRGLSDEHPLLPKFSPVAGLWEGTGIYRTLSPSSFIRSNKYCP
jgi:hypothetical protein